MLFNNIIGNNMQFEMNLFASHVFNAIQRTIPTLSHTIQR